MKTPKELETEVRGYQNGDRESFERIYTLSWPYLYTCVSHVVKDHHAVMDVMQETYLEISRSIEQLKDTEKFLSWAAVIANRKCLAYLKKEDPAILMGMVEEADDANALGNMMEDEAFIPEEIMQDREKSRLILEIIDGLSDMQRMCVIGYYYREQSQEELAEELGIPLNTVKSHLNRAKAKIKVKVEELKNKKNTALYTLLPFMRMLFAKEMELCDVPPMPDRLTAHAVQDVQKIQGRTPGKGALKKTMQLSVKTKIIIGAVAAAGVVAVISMAVPHSSVEDTPEAEEVVQEEPEVQEEVPTVPAEVTQEDPEIPEEAEEEEVQESVELTEASVTVDMYEGEHEALAISGIYDDMGIGKDGRIPVCLGEKWGLVNYDNEVIVPIEYDYAVNAPNEEGQTVFGTEGSYKVFDREGNEIFQTDKRIRSVSKGIVLWVEADTDTELFSFGYVKLDGTVLLEQYDRDNLCAGAVGFSDGYAFACWGGAEYQISPDGTQMDIFAKRDALRHPERMEEDEETKQMVNGTGYDTNSAYPIGASCGGYYMSRYMPIFDERGRLYIFDTEGNEQYTFDIKSLAEYAGYTWGMDDVRWNLRGFYNDGNICYNNGTCVAISYRR